MEEIIKVDESKIEDVFSVISKCSAWMSTQHGMNHWTDYYTKEVLLKKFKHEDVYIYYLNKEPIATITLSLKAPEYYVNNSDGNNGETVNYVNEFPSSNLENTKALYIVTLGVIPEQQGKGIASKLLAMAEEKAKEVNCNVIRFDSRMSFSIVINFYLKKGYERVGTMIDEGEEYGLFEKQLIE